jgi:CubicO group peptidase (beta-lactamase class C family)
MRKLLILILPLLLACAQEQPGRLSRVAPERAGMDPAKLARVDSVILASIAEGNMPGAVLSVVRGDKIVYLKAYGNKQVVPDTVAMTPETVFDLASLSKCVGTTLSFMQLVEQGRVRLTDPVERYIPGFLPWTDPATGETVDITVKDLMTHSSGLTPYLGVQSLVDRYGENCPDSTVRYIATEVRRNFRPKTDFMYSCLNFVTLQRILEGLTGERLADYAQHHVFDALGLEQTCYLPKEHPDILPLVAPTEVQEDGLPLVGDVHDPLARRLNGGNSGNAGVFSNAEDMSLIAAAIMGGGAVHGRRILGPETVRTMAAVPAENAPHIGRALGWDVCSDHAGIRGDLTSRTHTLCHTGYTGTSMVIDLDSRTAIILLANRVHPTDDGALARTRACVANIVAGSLLD